MPPSPSPAESDRNARCLRLRLLRQVNTLKRGQVDRFLALSETLRETIPNILPGIAGARRDLIEECQSLLSVLETAGKEHLNSAGEELVRLEIDRKIREFLAKKEEP